MAEEETPKQEKEEEKGGAPATGEDAVAPEEAAKAGSAAADSEAAAGHMSEEELRQRLEEHFREQNVADVLVQFLISLSTLAYVKMGLPEGAESHKDMEQAGLAIDSFKSLLEAAEGRLPEQDAQALAGALASMQVTFARVSGSS